MSTTEPTAMSTTQVDDDLGYDRTLAQNYLQRNGWTHLEKQPNHDIYDYNVAEVHLPHVIQSYPHDLLQLAAAVADIQPNTYLESEFDKLVYADHNHLHVRTCGSPSDSVETHLEYSQALVALSKMIDLPDHTDDIKLFGVYPTNSRIGIPATPEHNQLVDKLIDQLWFIQDTAEQVAAGTPIQLFDSLIDNEKNADLIQILVKLAQPSNTHGDIIIDFFSALNQPYDPNRISHIYFSYEMTQILGAVTPTRPKPDRNYRTNLF